jgi:hypothetical protein
MLHQKFKRMKYLHAYFCAVGTGLLLAFAACRPSDFSDLEIAERGSEYAFPLFSTTVNLRELMTRVVGNSPNGTLTIGADNTMKLSYSGDVAKRDASDVFKFLQGGLLPISDTVYAAPLGSPDSVSIAKAVVSKGTIQIIVYNTLSEPIKGTLYIPQMSANGKAFSYPFEVEAANGKAWQSPPIELKGNTLLTKANKLEFRYEAYRPNGERVKMPNVPILNIGGIAVSFQNLEFSYLEGYWGYEIYPLTRDTIEIDLNQTNLTGDVRIYDPQVTMTVSNSWGFPTQGLIKYLGFIGANGEELKLETTVFKNNTLDFNYPAWIKGEVGQTKKTIVRFDRTNSNIAEIFNARPRRFIYEVDGVANAQRDSKLVGFLTDSSRISLGVSVDLTLDGSAKQFGADQTVDLDFGEYAADDLDQLESAEFKLVTENSAPIGATFQSYFLDARGEIIDSLFTGPAREILTPAAIDANGQASGSSRTETFTPMTAARFDRVRQAKKALLRASFSTAQGGNRVVRLLANQQAIIKMGVRVKQK